MSSLSVPEKRTQSKWRLWGLGETEGEPASFSKDSSSDLVFQFVLSIAQAMEYISQQGVVRLPR